MDHNHKSRHPPGRWGGSQQQVVSLLTLTAAFIVLFTTVLYHETSPSMHHHIIKASDLLNQDGSADELKQLVKQLREQVAALHSTLPDTIQQQLRVHQASSQQPGPQPQQESPTQQLQAVSKDAPWPRRPAVPAGVGVSGGVGQPDVTPHHMAMAGSACQSRGGPGIKLPPAHQLVAPVVIVAHNRVHYLAKTLMGILRYWIADPSNAQRFPLFVSVDGGDPATMHFAAALNFGAQVQVIHNLRDTRRCSPNKGYCNLSVHYHMLLQLFFECHKAPRLLFLEEDLEIAPDFFSYFAAFAPILDRDPSLMCVSAWNDHGQRGRAGNSTVVYRTDIFPGLGWMLTDKLAKQIYDKWPNIYWDEYMRRPDVRQGRQCIFPEVPRTHTFGEVGTSKGQFYNQHLATMLLNQDSIDWSKQDLSYLEGPAYSQLMSSWLSAAQPLPQATDITQYCSTSLPDHKDKRDVLVRFTNSTRDFPPLARQLPPMLTDVKGGPEGPGTPLVPRGSYNGITIVRCRGKRIFLAPEQGSAADPTAMTAAKDSIQQG